MLTPRRTFNPPTLELRENDDGLVLAAAPETFAGKQAPFGMAIGPYARKLHHSPVEPIFVGQ